MIASDIALIAVGGTLGVLDICPIITALWTPSWALFSSAWCLLFLPPFYAAEDVAGLKWACKRAGALSRSRRRRSGSYA
jgi:predicted acyltransferase